MHICAHTMAHDATPVCKYADMTSETSMPSADDLLVLLAVGRTGRFNTAADDLGVNHTTISRRITNLERTLGGRVLVKAAGGWELTELGQQALTAAERVEAAVHGLVAEPGGGDGLKGVVRVSATDGFSAYIAAPAGALIRRRHPEVSVEIVAVTRRASQHRSGLDIEVVVGKPQVHRAEAVWLADYTLGLYASRSYLERKGTPRTVVELADHSLVYFIDSMLQVDELDLARRLTVSMRESVTSTNVFVHVEATRAAAGIGLLPCFMADRHDDLVRVLPGQVEATLAYWLVARPESLRRPEVAAVVAAVRETVESQRDALAGR
jgi:DNA-binding transcriptional LysR family regulator